MKKFPDKIKIGGHVVKIDCSKELTVNGQYDWEKGTIEICKTLPETHKEATLVHEIFHVLNSTFNDQNLNAFLAHSVVDSLSEQFYQVLKDNKLHF